MKKVLLSGFGPFLDIQDNPSEQIVQSLTNQFSCPHVILPVVFEKSFEVLKEKFFEVNPDVILMFGVAANRSKIGFERIGLNWVESKKPDITLKIPRSGRIDSNQELALMTSVDLEKLFSQFDSHDRQALEISYSAGAYVCNDLYFRMLNEKSIRAEKLFIHIPPFAAIEKIAQVALMSQVVRWIRGPECE